MITTLLSALLAVSAVMFGGGAMDPNGSPHAAAATSGDKGWGMDPNGSPHAAAADQGSMIDPDGKPSR
jgi:hypothetical protein